MSRILTAISVCLLLCFVVKDAKSQNPSFIASVDRNRVAVGEQFELTFTLSGSSSGTNFQSPSFGDFLTLSGPNQSTNMNIINGSVSSSISYGYVLQPRAEGKFTIGPASIEYGGKALHTQPINIEVTKGAPPSKQPSKQAEESDVGKQIGDNLFLKVTVDKARAYQGEQITATYKIYTRVNVVNYGVSKVPALTGFWSEDLDVPKQIQLTTEVINGKQYRVGVLKKSALFPQHSGTLEIDPMEVDCVVQMQTRKRSNDIFDQFFNDPFFGNVTNVNHKIRNEPLKITISALPTAGVPAGFSGAVGKFSMEAWLDKHQTKTNEAVTLKVKITGRGNLKLLEAPTITVPPDLERYDPKISDNITKQDERIAGSRTFEFLMIPRHAGEQKIPSFPFSYFDIEKKNFVTVNSPEFVITVEKGADLAVNSATGISKEDVKLLGEDIRFVKSENSPLRRKGDTFARSALFYTLSVSPVLALFGLVVYVRRRERVFGNVTLLRNRKARKTAQRRLTEAKKFLDAKKKEEFYGEVSRALWGYVGDKLGLPPADLSVLVVQTSLASRNVGPEAIAKLTSTIEECEFARFAPSSDSMQMDGAYHGAVELIASLEEQL